MTLVSCMCGIRKVEVPQSRDEQQTPSVVLMSLTLFKLASNFCRDSNRLLSLFIRAADLASTIIPSSRGSGIRLNTLPCVKEFKVLFLKVTQVETPHSVPIGEGVELGLALKL